ncbi:hypothetical protein NN561_006989 [Cricetulus griseus]
MSSAFADPGEMLRCTRSALQIWPRGSGTRRASGCSQVPGFRALPRHSLEDKAAIAALTDLHGWAARGARLRKGGFGRGTGSFHGNVPGAERQSALVPRGPARAGMENP